MVVRCRWNPMVCGWVVEIALRLARGCGFFRDRRGSYNCHYNISVPTQIYLALEVFILTHGLNKAICPDPSYIDLY